MGEPLLIFVGATVLQALLAANPSFRMGINLTAPATDRLTEWFDFIFCGPI